MLKLSHVSWIVVAGGLAGAACDGGPIVGAGAYQSGGPGCPEWSCGGNSPVVNDTIVGEIDLDHTAGDGGFRYVAFVPPLLHPLALSLDVKNGMFQATTATGAEYTGAQLVGGMLVLEDLRDLSLHVIIIDGFDYIDSWTDPAHPVPAYHLTSTTIDLLGAPGEVCGAVAALPGGGTFTSHWAVLVADERYDPAAKVVSVSGPAADRWFNIACNGSALSKMKLLGYDPEHTTTATTHATTAAQRQATIKMLTADYCGTGASFTVEGQPLLWYNAGDWAVAFGEGGNPSSEAIWTADGALCLDTPRLEGDEPDIGDDIAAECGGSLPACAALLPGWEPAGEWRTSNPTP